MKQFEIILKQFETILKQFDTILFPQDMIQDIYKLHWNIYELSMTPKSMMTLSTLSSAYVRDIEKMYQNVKCVHHQTMSKTSTKSREDAFQMSFWKKCHYQYNKVIRLLQYSSTNS